MSAKFFRGLVSLSLCTLLGLTFIFAAPNLISEQTYSLTGAYNNLLYPENAYKLYTSTLAGIKSKVLLLDTALLERAEWITDTRVDASIGAFGGLKKYLSQELEATAGLSLFLPSGKGTVLALDINGNYDSLLERTEQKDYTNASQASVDLLDDMQTKLGAGIQWASSTKSTRFGLKLGYDFEGAGAVADIKTDYTQTPAALVIGDVLRSADSFTHTATAGIDWGFTSGVVSLNLGLEYGFNYIDKKNRYLTLDEDGDKNHERFLSYTEWVAEYNTLNPTIPYTLAIEDYTLGHKVDIFSLVRIDLTKNLEWLLSARYTPLDRAERIEYLHLTSSADPLDESFSQTIDTQDWGNFSAGTVFSVTGKDLVKKVRFGGEFERSADYTLLDGLEKSGATYFSRNNHGHYFEAALGLNPAVNSLNGLSINPSLRTEHQVRLASSVDLELSKKVYASLGMDADLSVIYDEYRVYNTDTETVWSALDTSYRISWNPIPRIAMLFNLAKNTDLVLNLGSFKAPGGFSTKTNSVPYDMQLTRTSENGAIDTSDSGDLSFDLEISMIFKF